MSDIERHTISVLVENEAGVLARVIGLFSGRGYNIESLTVAEVDPADALSRITVVTTGTPMIIVQIKAQLSRLVRSSFRQRLACWAMSPLNPRAARTSAEKLGNAE